MIKVTISDTKKCTTRFDVTSFDITIKNKKRVRKGTLTVDVHRDEFRLNAPCLLEKIDEKAVKDETLEILKNIFYYFSKTIAKKEEVGIIFINETYLYTFIDETHLCVPRQSIIELLMQYNQSEFDRYKVKEKIITQVKLSYDTIYEEHRMGNVMIKLKALHGFCEDEIVLYKKVLMKCLKANNIEGRMEDVSRDYNLQYKIEHPHSYRYNQYYVFNFMVRKRR